MKIGRREFLKSSLCLGTSALINTSTSYSQSVNCKILVLPDEPIGIINPNIYNHLISDAYEIGDGIWVGENSKIPNINGVRRELIECLQNISPQRINYIYNDFGYRSEVCDFRREQQDEVDEFFEEGHFNDGDQDDASKRLLPESNIQLKRFLVFCHFVQSSPHVSLNLRNVNTEDWHNLVKDISTSKNKRSNLAGIFSGTQYWNIANEHWGKGGDYFPEDYADAFYQLAKRLPLQGDATYLTGSGPSGSNVDWTDRFFSKYFKNDPTQTRKLRAWTIRYCCGTTGDAEAVDYNHGDWYEFLSRSKRMETIIRDHWKCLKDSSQAQDVKLVVNEWGARHRKHPEMPFKYGYAGTLRDALISAIHLDTFQRHADKVISAAPSQMVNANHSLFLVEKEKFIVTPNYHVFKMYKSHAGKSAVRTEFEASYISFKQNESQIRIAGLMGSASIHKKSVILTVVNPSINSFQETEINIKGRNILSAKAKVLSSKNINAHNSFEFPRELEPKDDSGGKQRNGKLYYQFIPASVTRLKITLT